MIDKPTYFFVLNGLLNGEQGVRAETAGMGDQLKDGWYYLLGNDPNGDGPHESRDEAEMYGTIQWRQAQAEELLVEGLTKLMAAYVFFVKEVGDNPDVLMDDIQERVREALIDTKHRITK